MDSLEFYRTCTSAYAFGRDIYLVISDSGDARDFVARRKNTVAISSTRRSARDAACKAVREGHSDVAIVHFDGTPTEYVYGFDAVRSCYYTHPLVCDGRVLCESNDGVYVYDGTTYGYADLATIDVERHYKDEWHTIEYYKSISRVYA